MFSPWLWPFQKHNFWSISSENSGKISEKTRIGFISEDTAQIELVKKTNLKRNGILQYDMNFCQHQNHHNKDIPNYRFSWFSTFSNFCPIAHCAAAPTCHRQVQVQGPFAGQEGEGRAQQEVFYNVRENFFLAPGSRWKMRRNSKHRIPPPLSSVELWNSLPCGISVRPLQWFPVKCRGSAHTWRSPWAKQEITAENLRREIS